jgi:hypothetical protein
MARGAGQQGAGDGQRQQPLLLQHGLKLQSSYKSVLGGCGWLDAMLGQTQCNSSNSSSSSSWLLV